MTFKQSAVKRTVTGTFQKPNGAPSEGKIFIKLSEPVLGRQENTVYTKQAVPIELDETGSFSEDLVVTSPGLTVEEIEELNEIKEQIATDALEMVTVQERINAYLKKVYDNVPITEADVIDNRNDLVRKVELQKEAAVLKQQEKVFLDKEKELNEARVIMIIECYFTNPTDKSKLHLVIPNGIEPIDIADLPRE